MSVTNLTFGPTVSQNNLRTFLAAAMAPTANDTATTNNANDM